MVSYIAKGTLKVQFKLRLLRWEDYSGLLRQAQCSHEGSYKSKREAGESESWEGDIVMEAEIKVIWHEKHSTCCCWLWRWRNGAKECGWRSEAGQVKKMGSCLQKKHIPTDILLFAQWDPFCTSDLRNCKISSCCFKSLGLWWFVILSNRAIKKMHHCLLLCIGKGAFLWHPSQAALSLGDLPKLSWPTRGLPPFLLCPHCSQCGHLTLPISYCVVITSPHPTVWGSGFCIPTAIPWLLRRMCWVTASRPILPFMQWPSQHMVIGVCALSFPPCPY